MKPTVFVIDELQEQPEVKHGHYYREFHGHKIDLYRIIDLFGPMEAAQQHALKKLMFAGDRNHKDKIKDIEETIDSLKRWLEMLEEDNEPNPTQEEDTTAQEVPVAGAIERVKAKIKTQELAAQTGNVPEVVEVIRQRSTDAKT